MNTKNLWTVEFSESQKAFHVDTLERILNKNIGMFLLSSNCNDWSLLAIFSSQEEANDAVMILRKKRSIEPVMIRFAREHCE